MNANRSHLTRICSACLLTGAAIGGVAHAAVANAADAPLAQIHASLALGPSVLGEATTVELHIADPADAPLGRLLVGVDLPGGISYVPHSVGVGLGGADFVVGAPRAVAVPAGGTELYWGNLPAPGRQTLDLYFKVAPGKRSAERFAGASWTLSASVHSDPIAAPSSPAAGGSVAGLVIEPGTAATARATAQVVPLQVTTSSARGLEQVVVSGAPSATTRDVVVHAYLPAGVTLAACSTAEHCATPTVTSTELPTVAGRPYLPRLASAAASASPATGTPRVADGTRSPDGATPPTPPPP
ncbi:MAG: hypothetical protein M0T80_05870, partial [Actinomycetota bacterium]|nr:hypothetical protein [Actinomycetota bacterium]